MLELPTYETLGPDPEAPGTRFDRMLCPLAMAGGRHEHCDTMHCPYYRVPGTVTECAVQDWSPLIRHHPELARWFSARREEIIRGRAHPVRHRSTER